MKSIEWLQLKIACELQEYKREGRDRVEPESLESDSTGQNAFKHYIAHLQHLMHSWCIHDLCERGVLGQIVQIDHQLGLKTDQPFQITLQTLCARELMTTSVLQPPNNIAHMTVRIHRVLRLAGG